ncbi:MAG: glycosyltransferase family 39 protein [Gammaproteobacteria bacterium]|nr:glycosyltransferase family 39 protein [Gammaproteobacteria bacterium]
MIDTKKSWFADLILLSLLCCLLYGVLLGARPLNTPDEGRYAEVAREMLVSGNYITPQLDQVAFLDKPPLVYWLTAGSLHIAGINSWAARVIPALFAWLGCLAVYVTARQLYSRRAAWLAASIQATALLYFGLAHYLNMDLTVAVLIGISLQSFLLGVKATRGNRWYFYIAYLSSAAAVLTKGMIGIVFPLMIIGSWIVLCQQWQVLKKMYLPTGLALFLLAALPWYIAVQQQTPEFWHYFFVHEQFTRFTGQQFNNLAPFWYYLPVIILGFYPWSVWLLPALKQAWQQGKQYNENVFLLLWLGLVTVFFSIPAAKISSYILPVFPALALITGNYVAQQWQQTVAWRWPIRVAAVCNSILAVACFYLARHDIPGVDFTKAALQLNLIAVILLLGSGIMLWFKQSLWRITSLAITIVGVAWLALSSIPLVLQDSVYPLTQKLIPLVRSNDHVVSYHGYYQDLPFYLQRQIMVVADWNDQGLINTDDSLGQLAWDKQYTPASTAWLIDEEAFWHAWHSSQRMFVFLDRTDLPNFIKQAHSPVYVMGEGKYTRLVSNQQPATT